MTPRCRLSFVAALSLYYSVDWLRGRTRGRPAIDHKPSQAGASMKIEAVRNGYFNGEWCHPHAAALSAE
jgi:hypothetical protein